MATACNFWPTIEAAIKQWFAGQNSTTTPTRSELGIDSLVCSICYAGELSIAEFQSKMDEDAVVLACGHLIGHECMQGWAQECRRRHQSLGCPVCRAPLTALRCTRHQVQCINLAVDEPFAVVAEKVQKMMDDNTRNEEAATTCRNEGCLEAAREREWAKRRIAEEAQASFIAATSPWANARRHNGV